MEDYGAKVFPRDVDENLHFDVIRGRGKEIKDVLSHAELKGAFPERTGISEGLLQIRECG